MELLKGDSWKWFEDALNNLAESSKAAYLPAFIGFLEWGGWDTESLYEEHLANSKAEDPRAIKRIPLKVVQYQKYLMREKGKSSMTATTVEKALKKFFGANELPFKITGEKIKVESEELPNITGNQLKRILNASGNFKVKAFILFAKDSGLRLGDITNLPIKKLRAAIEDPEIKYYTFEWKTRKTGRIANPVIGPETLEALRTWMDHRINALNLSAEDDDPLFCTERSRGAYIRRGIDIKETKKGDWMVDSTMGVIFANLVKKARLEPNIDGKLPSIHSCRKYHKTNLESGGCPASWINRMQGRKGEGTGGTYTKPNPEQLIELYSRAYDKLSIYEKTLSAFEMERQNAINGTLMLPIPQEETTIRIEKIQATTNSQELRAVLMKFSEEQLKEDARKQKWSRQVTERPKLIEVPKEDVETYQKMDYYVVGDAFNGNVYMRKK